MKILFLDVDGTLNSTATFQRRNDLIELGGESVDSEEVVWPMGHLDERNILLLNPIVEQTGCKIVISSHWRLSDKVGQIGKWLARKGFKYPTSIIGWTGSLAHLENSRGEEIKEWLTNHPAVTRYAILDDDGFDIVPVHPKNYVYTDGNEGLTEERAQAVISILNN